MLEATVAPAPAFPGNGQQRAELAEIAALKKEVAKLRAERDIPKMDEAIFRH
jgi:transposase